MPDFVPYDGKPETWDEPSPEMQRGLELAAAICLLYGDGQRWADAILSRGEQIRARFYADP